MAGCIELCNGESNFPWSLRKAQQQSWPKGAKADNNLHHPCHPLVKQHTQNTVICRLWKLSWTTDHEWLVFSKCDFQTQDLALKFALYTMTHTHQGDWRVNQVVDQCLPKPQQLKSTSSQTKQRLPLLKREVRLCVTTLLNSWTFILLNFPMGSPGKQPN